MNNLLLSLSVTLILNLTCFGQKSEIESLVNSALPLIVSEDFEYFNLLDSGLNTEFDSFIMNKNEAEALRVKYPDFSYEEFLSLAQNDSAIVDWNDFNIKNARIYSYEDIPAFKSLVRNYHLVPFGTSSKDLKNLNQSKHPHEIVVPVKKHWDQQRIQKECENASSKYIKSMKQEDKTYFWFSKPLISKNGFAIITLNEGGKGATYIFKKINNNWQNIYTFNYWVS